MRSVSRVGCATCAALLLTSLASAAMPFIEVDPGRSNLLRERGTGKPFIPVGVNYFDPQTGWAPKIWKQFDEKRVGQHLDLIRKQGFNTIRVFLTLDAFHRNAGQFDAEGEAKFRKLLAMCSERGIYLIPSGPDHWEGLPAWYKGDKYADETILKAEDEWWGEFAAKFRDEPAILVYDLYNEPSVSWDSPAMLAKWNEWLKDRYDSAEAIATAWARHPQEIGRFGAVPIPLAQPLINDARLYEYQQFRESVADEWTRRHASAIRAADPNHLITVGQIQWAVPIYLPGIQHYAGFNIQSNARFVDFVTVHFYPLAPPRPCDSPSGIQFNSVYLEALLHMTTAGKPLMLGEFNWYGGGAISAGGKVIMPSQTVEQQSAWCMELLQVSRGRCCGWLNWGFADTPEANDTSRWSGIWTTDLKLKPWGDQFGRFAREVTARPPESRSFPQYLTSFPFDRKAMLTNPEVGLQYLRQLRDARVKAAASQPVK